MGRIIIIVAVFMAVFAIYFAIDHYKDAYMALPLTPKNEVKAAPFSDWKEYSPESKKFSASFPVVPQNATEVVPIPKSDKKRVYDMFVSEQINGTIYMISQITYPNDYDTSAEKTLLHMIVDEMMTSNPNNKLDKIADEVFQGHKAVAFTIENKEIKIEGKTFMVGKMLYILTYMAKTPDFTDVEFDHFIKSFKLLNENDKKVDAQSSEIPKK